MLVGPGVKIRKRMKKNTNEPQNVDMALRMSMVNYLR